MLGPDIIGNYLFYDALSGEFLPPTDQEHRIHTLGRLAVATFEKGANQYTHRATYAYKPNWALGSIATAEAQPKAYYAALNCAKKTVKPGRALTAYAREA